MSIHVERRDGTLGSWTLARWSPAQDGLVEGIWYFEGSTSPVRERHFPGGYLEVIVHLGQSYGRVTGQGIQSFPRCCLSGISTSSQVIEPAPEPTAILGLRLRPPGAFALVGHPLHDLTDLTIDLDHLVPDAAQQLLRDVHAAPSPKARVRAAEGWLARMLESGPPPDAAVAWAAEQIERRGGTVAIGALQEATGWGRTRFTRVFREQIGVTAKRYARLHRFRAAMDGLIRGDASLVELALSCGFSDQAHFNREFKALSGFTPTGYLARTRFPDTVSVAERMQPRGRPT